MKVSLPSGGEAEFRDTLLRGDARAARGKMVVVISPDGSRRMEGNVTDDVTGELIRHMLIAWPRGALPRDAHTADLAAQMLDQVPDEDYAVLEKAVGPWVERILRRNSTSAVFTHVATGVKVEPANPDDAAKLAASADFTRETPDEPGPKSLPTGTASSENPDASGQP